MWMKPLYCNTANFLAQEFGGEIWHVSSSQPTLSVLTFRSWAQLSVPGEKAWPCRSICNFCKAFQFRRMIEFGRRGWIGEKQKWIRTGECDSWGGVWTLMCGSVLKHFYFYIFYQLRSCFLIIDLEIRLKALGTGHMLFSSWWIIAVYGGSV